MKDFAIDPYTKDYELKAGQFALTDDIRNNIYLSLSVRLGTFPFAPKLGSLLHLLQREKALPGIEKKAKEYCDKALKWIVDKGRAEKIDVYTKLDQNLKRVACKIEAFQNGKKITYVHFVKVR